VANGLTVGSWQCSRFSHDGDTPVTRRRVPNSEPGRQEICWREHSWIPTTRFGFIGRLAAEKPGSVGTRTRGDRQSESTRRL